jgi:hypothetical protein
MTFDVYGHLFPSLEDDHAKFAAGELAVVGRLTIGWGPERFSRVQCLAGSATRLPQEALKMAELLGFRETENPCVGGSIPPLGTTSQQGSGAAALSRAARLAFGL